MGNKWSVRTPEQVLLCGPRHVMTGSKLLGTNWTYLRYSMFGSGSFSEAFKHSASVRVVLPTPTFAQLFRKVLSKQLLRNASSAVITGPPLRVGCLCW